MDQPERVAPDELSNDRPKATSSSSAPSTPQSSVHLNSSSGSSPALSSCESSSSIVAPDPAGPDRRHVICRVEYICDVDARRSLVILRLSGFVAVAATVVLLALKASPRTDDIFVLNRGFHVANVAVGGALLAGMLPYYAGYVWRVAACVRAGKSWSARRWHTVETTLQRGAAIVANLLLFVAVNVAVLARPALWCSGDAVSCVGCASLTLWNFLFASHTYYARCLVLIPRPASCARADLSVADMPLSYHWPLLLLAAAVQGAIICTLIGATSDAVIGTSFADPSTHACTWGERLHCAPHAVVVVSTSIVVAGFVVYWLWTVIAIVKAWRQVHRRPYEAYKVTHAKIRLQIQYLTGYTVAIVSSVLLWVAGSNACVNYALVWFGVLPVTISMSGLVWLNMYLTKPRSPDAPPLAPNDVLQRIAWTEASIPAQMERRNQHLLDPAARHAPMFCMETAIKLFYWSALVYDYTEAEGHTFSSLPEDIRVLLGEVAHAMTFYKLASRRLFYDRTLETKILSAWSERVILISIRGSHAVANFVADAQVLQATHPPSRRHQGQVPRVHLGFLRSWHSRGINKLLIEHVQQLLDSAENRSDVQVLLTGHSLGGALATLAAHDIVTMCNVRPDQISVYTFGCPRVGNHAFARDYGETVPDSWSVINDQDVVTRGLKLYGLYKRAGHRVIINSAGDLIVRPSLFELTLMQLPFSASAAHHHTTSYQAALYSVLRNQIDKGKRHGEGLTGVLELLKSAPIVGDALHQMAVKTGHASLADQLRSISLVSVNASSGSVRVDGGEGVGSALEEALSAVPVRTNARGGEEYEPVHGEGADAAASVDIDPTDAAPSESAPPPLPSTGQTPPAAGKPPSVESVAVDMPTADPAAARAAPRRLWGRAAQHLRLGGRRDGCAPLPPDVHRSGKCYDIPEDDGRLSEELGGGVAAPPRGSGWRCPLRAADSELPRNARLHADGAIISIGSSPNMRACRCHKKRSAEAAAARTADDSCALDCPR